MYEVMYICSSRQIDMKCANWKQICLYKCVKCKKWTAPIFLLIEKMPYERCENLCSLHVALLHSHFLPLTSMLSATTISLGTLHFHSHMYLAPSLTRLFSSIHWFSFVRIPLTFTDKTYDTQYGTDFHQKLFEKKELKNNRRKKSAMCWFHSKNANSEIVYVFHFLRVI